VKALVMHKGTGDPVTQFEAVVGDDGELYGLYPPMTPLARNRRPRSYFHTLHKARLAGCNVLYHGYGATPDEARAAARALLPML